jgi:type VI secretion system protein ImpL
MQNLSSDISSSSGGGIQQLSDRHVRRILGYANLAPVDSQLRFGTDAFSASVQARITRWERILRSLDQYEAQEPGTPLVELERFIRQDMAATGPGACPPRGSLPAASTAEWFGAVHDRIARAYQVRCGELAAAQVSAGYEALRAFFNASLSGRFPFAPPSQARLAPDADPFSVREFLRRQDALLGPLGEDAFAAIRNLQGGDEVVTFLASMERLRPLLTPLLATDEEPARGIEFRVDFRTSRALERGADQIAEWTLQVGEQRMSLGQDEGLRQGTWRPGQPVELSLRWASGSPRRPVVDVEGAGGGGAGGRVEGARISFRQDGPWGLLRLMSVFAPTAESLLGASLGGGQPEPGSLLLLIPTAQATGTAAPPRPSPGAGDGAGLTVAFVRIRLRDPASGTLTSPGPFPVVAPALHARSPGSGGP